MNLDRFARRHTVAPRPSIPEGEAKQARLPLLLDGYAPTDADPLTPLRDCADAAFDMMLPFCAVKGSAGRGRLIGSGAVHPLARAMQEYDWPKPEQ